jgi:hypothetical protein
MQPCATKMQPCATNIQPCATNIQPCATYKQPLHNNKHLGFAKLVAKIGTIDMDTKPCGFGIHIRAKGVSPLKPRRPTDAETRLA